MNSEKKCDIFSEKAPMKDEYGDKEKRMKRSLEHQRPHFHEEMKYIRQLEKENSKKRRKNVNFFWCVWDLFLSTAKDGSI